MYYAARTKIWQYTRALGFQLGLLTALCLIMTIGSFGAYLAHSQADALETAMKQHASAVARQLANSIIHPLTARDYIAVERQLLAITDLPNLRDIYVIDAHGSITSHVTADELGNLTARFQRIALQVPSGASAMQAEDNWRLATWEPINLAHATGWVHIVSDLSPISNTRSAIYQRTALSGILAVVISLGVVLLFLRPRVAALNGLAQFAEELDIRLGDRIKIYRGSSDIEALGKSLNHASERLYADDKLLRVSEMQLRTVVENMPVLMNAFDTRGNIIVWNKECERVTGYTADEIIDNPRAIELLYPDADYRNAILAEWRQRGSRFAGWPLVVTTKSGSRRTIAWSNISDDFPINGWASWAIGVDITETVENERLKDEFVSTVNHELRTPLTAIRGALGLVASSATGAIPAPALELVKIAERNCDRLARLITNILDMQRLQTGEINLELVSIDAVALVEEAVAVNRPFAEQFGIDLQYVRPDDPTVSLNGNADKLIQVLTNLISNAVKHSPKGETVAIGVGRRDDSVVISVQDRGSGIPKEFRNKIFRRFSRVDDHTTSHISGSGLGLYISKSIVDLHGGELYFEDNAEGGTTFFVTLPAAAQTLRSRAYAAGEG